MPTKRTPLRRRVRGELSSDQELALWLGCSRNGSQPFETEAEAAELWRRHAPRLMELFARNGHRPLGWWQYDAPEGLEFDYDTEQSTLYEAGVLSESEAAALVTYWREEFSRANAPGFGYCAGLGKYLRGQEAREAHYAWADIPTSLLERWRTEREAAVAS